MKREELIQYTCNASKSPELKCKYLINAKRGTGGRNDKGGECIVSESEYRHSYTRM